MGFRSRKQPARLLFDQRIPPCSPGWAINLVLVMASLFPNPLVRVGNTNGQCLPRLRCFLSFQVNVVLAVTYSGIEERLTKIVLKRVRDKHGGLAVISTATGIVAVPLPDRPQKPTWLTIGPWCHPLRLASGPDTSGPWETDAAARRAKVTSQDRPRRCSRSAAGCLRWEAAVPSRAEPERK